MEYSKRRFARIKDKNRGNVLIKHHPNFLGEFVVSDRGGSVKGLISRRSNIKNGFAGIVGNFLLAENSHIFGEMKSDYLIGDT